jgi:Uma2 family endonuclease
MSTAANAITMLPYRRQGEIDYPSLEFDPNEKNVTPDAMEQNLELQEILGLLRARFTDFNRRPAVFLDNETFICYEPSNLNIRISPDVYLAFGVDAQAIRPRKLYLPWEVGKPPDWALEVASESTAQEDVNRKPGIYAAVGIPEYWRFDPTGGEYHGRPLAGERLVNGAYQPIPLTTEPDGILKGYSAILELSLCWDEGWPRFYDPATATYLENWRQDRAAREAERLARLSAEAERDAERAERLAAETENERLREQIRRLQSEG